MNSLTLAKALSEMPSSQGLAWALGDPERVGAPQTAVPPVAALCPPGHLAPPTWGLLALKVRGPTWSGLQGWAQTQARWS